MPSAHSTRCSRRWKRAPGSSRRGPRSWPRATRRCARMRRSSTRELTRSPPASGRCGPLRGLRVDEAEARLVKALDDAVLADLPYLRVIHGKGTGAVRERVHEVLAADPRVQRFGFAPANQGGHGVTIVEFTA